MRRKDKQQIDIDSTHTFYIDVEWKAEAVDKQKRAHIQATPKETLIENEN